MKILVFSIRACVSTTLLLISLSTHAALTAVDIDGNTSNGHEGVYDSVLDITWLANANLAASNDFGLGTNANGSMDWFEAEAFILAMNTDGGSGYLGVNSWRQTTASGCDGNGCGDAPVDTADELGYHYYQNFGAVAGLGTGGMNAGTNTTKIALFSNIQPAWYWTGTDRELTDPTRAWDFSANIGRQSYGLKLGNNLYVWAVTPGMVGTATGAVPVPAALWLFVSGLAGLGALKQKRFCQKINKQHTGYSSAQS